jgi:hypothetical protein
LNRANLGDLLIVVSGDFFVLKKSKNLSKLSDYFARVIGATIFVADCICQFISLWVNWIALGSV